MKKNEKPKATTMTPIDQLNKPETIQHYNAVMIEELTSKFKFVLEKSEGAEERTRQFIGTLHKQTQERFDVVEGVLRYHSELFEKIDQRFDRLEEKVDGHDKRFDRLEKKVDGLETKMTEVVEAVQHHEKEIQELKKAV